MNAILSHYLTKARPVIATAIDMLFPARCAACRESVGRHGALCVPCWQNMAFISAPYCHKCGVPFEYTIGEKALCGRCMQHKPAYTEARAVMRYDENSRSHILALKYGDKTQLAPIYGEWLMRIALEYKHRAHYILPVPLYYTRLLGRRYNQAALLAYALAKYMDLPVLPDSLVRIRKTPKQAGFTRRQREDNVRGAFRVREKKRDQLKGKSVILVDDVMTTGATLEACARNLHDAGVRDVYVVTIARTVLAD